MINSLFTLFKNIILALFIPLTLVSSYKINDKKKYVIFLSMIHFLLLQFLSPIINNQIIVGLLIILNIIPLIIKKQKTIDCILSCSVYIILIFSISNAVEHIVSNYFQFNQLYDSVIDFSSLISNIIIITVCICLFLNRKNLILIVHKKSDIYKLILELIMLISMMIVTTTDSSTAFNTNSVSLILIIQLFELILFIFITKKIEQLNNENIMLEKEKQKQYFVKQKYQAMLHIKDEVESKNHYMFYIIYSLKKMLEEKRYDEAYQLTNQYINQHVKKDILLDTGNNIFDFIIGSLLNQLIKKEIDVKTIIAIQTDSFYDEITFVNFIYDLLNININTNKITFSLIDKNDYVLIKIEYQNSISNYQMQVETLINNFPYHNNLSYHIEDHILSISLKKQYTTS